MAGEIFGYPSHSIGQLSFTASSEPGWCCAEMECEDCGHPWVAVFPLGCVSAECPHCGHYTPTPEAYDIQPPVPEGN